MTAIGDLLDEPEEGVEFGSDQLDETKEGVGASYNFPSSIQTTIGENHFKGRD